jgi:hypothetical protein
MRLPVWLFRPQSLKLQLPSLPRWRMPQLPRFRVRLARPVSQWLLIVVFMLYAEMGVIIYFQYVQPWIHGESVVRIGADSDRYWDAVDSARAGTGESLVSVTSNFLGPVLLGLLLHNGFAVMCFNIGLFVFAMKIAGSIPGVNKTIFGYLMLFNAELLPSLTTLNKEILALFAAVLTAKYLLSDRRSTLLLALTLLVSFLARWEQAAILILFLLLQHSPLRFRPKLALGLIVCGLSVIYPLGFRVLHIDPHIFDYLLQNANTIIRLNSIQASGGFVIVVLPKIFMTMAGRLATPWFYWSGDFLKDHLQDPQQDIFQPLGCLAFLLVFAYAILKKKLQLKRPLPMLIVLTMVISAVSPFIQPRYLYAGYILLCLEIAGSQVPLEPTPDPL